MNHETKRNLGLFLLGSAVVVAGISAYLYFDTDARESVEAMINREKAKLFVRHHLNGSPAMVAAVEKLSESEVNTLVKLADSANKIKDNVASGFEGFVQKARQMSDHVTDRISDHF